MADPARSRGVSIDSKVRSANEGPDIGTPCVESKDVIQEQSAKIRSPPAPAWRTVVVREYEPLVLRLCGTVVSVLSRTPLRRFNPLCPGVVRLQAFGQPHAVD